MENFVGTLSTIAVVLGVILALLAIIAHFTCPILCISHWGYLFGSCNAFLAGIALSSMQQKAG